MTVSSMLSDAQQPLLETKRFVPRWRSDFVTRPRLVKRLEDGKSSALTLISVPAGFGKTTLLAEWLAAPEAPLAAWVSLDSGDNDPALFWSYLISALRSILPTAGTAAIASLRSAQPPPIESVLTTLINELASVPDPVAIVLDDYHVITAEPVHRGITFLIENLPPHVRLVIASRSDPPLPLSRLRGRGDLTELRASDLRFTAGEATDFLNSAMGLELPVATAEALGQRTEGWIAGLQLAAISMRDESDMVGFVEAFAGTTRYVVDYLVDEILQRQDEATRAFLLETSILERFNGALCAAVTGRNDSRAMLDHLERSNLFLVPLDDRRNWFRYHHLFADVLRAHLRDDGRFDEALLHRRAATWFRDHDVHSDAIRHALAAGEPEFAAELVERAEPFMRQSRQEATLLTWYKQLPRAVIEARPVLTVGFAFALLSNGQLADVERLLALAESVIGSAPPVNEGEARLKGELAVARAGICLAVGDLPGSATHARQALDLVGADDYFWRGAASAILGLIEWSDGRLDEAFRLFSAGMNNLRVAGYISDAIGGSTALADIRMTQGRPGDALAILEGGLRLAADHGAPELRGTADMHASMSEIHLERGELDAAAQSLQRSLNQGDHTGFPRHPWRWRVAMARLCDARGEVTQALELLDEAERLYVSDFNPDARPVAAWRALIQLRNGKRADAKRWADQTSLSSTDSLTYLREFEHLTYARILLSRASSDDSRETTLQAARLLDRLLAAARAGERNGNVLEILIARAIAADTLGEARNAEEFVREALLIAEPLRYVQVFNREGEVIRPILRSIAAGGTGASFARRLLASNETAGVVPLSGHRLPEPLTGREIEILRLIATGMRNEEIGDQLFISHATVKRHIANAYGKLGVTNRAGAIARLHELDLI